MAKELSQSVQDMKKELDEALKDLEWQIRYNQFVRGGASSSELHTSDPNGGYRLNLRQEQHIPHYY